MEIVIVGDNIQGWLTASMLCQNLSNHNITLIADEDDKEVDDLSYASPQRINHLFDYIGLSSTNHQTDFKRKWMPVCNANLINGIRMENFYLNGETYDVPWGFVSMSNSNLNLRNTNMWFCLNHVYPELFPRKTFSPFVNNNGELMNYNKQMDDVDGFFNLFNHTSYVFRGHMLKEYLKEQICSPYPTALPGGVRYQKGVMAKDYIQSDEGYVIEIHTNDNSDFKKLFVDLVIDCTGHKSKILNGLLKTEFINFDSLKNNNSLYCYVPYGYSNNGIDFELHNRLTNTAIPYESGYVQHFCLENEIFVQYIYSDKYTDKERASEVFKDFLIKRFKEENPIIKEKKIVNGRHKEAIKNNVFAVGDSYGSFEPMFCSGMFALIENLLVLVDLISKKDGFINEIDKQNVNYVLSNEMDFFKPYIESPFAYNRLNGSKYWTDYRMKQKWNLKTENDFITDLAKISEASYSIRSYEKYFNNAGLIYVLAGSDYSPYPKAWFKNIRYSKDNKETYENVRDTYIKHKESVNKMIAKDGQSSHSYLINKIYKRIKK